MSSPWTTDAMDESRFEQLGGSRRDPDHGRPSEVHRARSSDHAALERTLADLDRLGIEPLDVWDEALFGFVVALDAAGMEHVRALAGRGTDRPRHRRDRRWYPVESAVGSGSDRSAIAAPRFGILLQRNRRRGEGVRDRHRTADYARRVHRSGAVRRVLQLRRRVPAIEDCNGHGTHVAGTVGGTTYGVAKGVSIIPVKVLVVQRVRHRFERHRRNQLGHRRSSDGTPAVANMSLGGPPSNVLDSAVQAMVDDGITVVVAAGNEAWPTCGVQPRPSSRGDHRRRFGDRRRRRRLLELRVLQ